MNAPSAAGQAGHYENFPVASWLCPPRLRPAVVAIYGFARTADDLADEGSAPASQRLADLSAYRSELHGCFQGRSAAPRWQAVFAPLQQAVHRFALPLAPLADLLDAFEQDVRRTGQAPAYADRAELLDYCRRSAAPIGRLLLHLYGVHDAQALQRSDHICNALQLINFWQDLSVDLPRGRSYVPAADCRAHGLNPAARAQWVHHPAAAALVASCHAWARDMMLDGAPLVHQLPGRAGWELRLVVQGGLRVLDKLQGLGVHSLQQRPTLSWRDAPVLLARALRM